MEVVYRFLNAAGSKMYTFETLTEIAKMPRETVAVVFVSPSHVELPHLVKTQHGQR